MSNPFKANDHKLKELIVYIVRRSEADEKLGAVKLNKLLFYCDFQAYLELGRPITGQEYVAREQGPAPRRMLQLRRELEQEGRLLIAARQYHGRQQHKHVALSEADISDFSAAEISIVERVLAALRHLSGSEVSELSHQFVGWLTAPQGEGIPYSTALIVRTDSTPHSKRVAESLEPTAAKYVS